MAGNDVSLAKLDIFCPIMSAKEMPDWDLKYFFLTNIFSS